MIDGMADNREHVPAIDIDRLLASLLFEVRDAGAVDEALDCGDLLAACLLDSFASQLITSWSGTALERAMILIANRTRARQDGVEGATQVWRVSGAELRLTTWASFVLRFLPACGYPDHAQT